MLSIEERLVEERIVLALAGTVDLYAVSDLQRRLDERASAPAARIVVDLAGVDFIDSSGLATLVRTRRNLRRVGGRLQLAAPTRRVRDIIDLMQLAQFFEIHDTVEEALAR